MSPAGAASTEKRHAVDEFGLARQVPYTLRRMRRTIDGHLRLSLSSIPRFAQVAGIATAAVRSSRRHAERHRASAREITRPGVV